MPKEKSRESSPRAPQPMGLGRYIPHLMFSPHSPVKESGIFNFQDRKSNPNFLRMELKGPQSGLREQLGSLGPSKDPLATSEDF